MRCPGDQVLQEFVEGGLNEVELDLLKVHLAECHLCREAVTQYKQLMWDLEHPEEPKPPAELDQMHAALMAVWHEQRKEAKEQKKRTSRSLIPAWTEYGLAWTRHMPRPEVPEGALSRTCEGVRKAVGLWRRVRRRGGGRR